MSVFLVHVMMNPLMIIIMNIMITTLLYYTKYFTPGTQRSYIVTWMQRLQRGVIPIPMSSFDIIVGFSADGQGKRPTRRSNNIPRTIPVDACYIIIIITRVHVSALRLFSISQTDNTTSIPVHPYLHVTCFARQASLVIDQFDCDVLQRAPPSPQLASRHTLSADRPEIYHTTTTITTTHHHHGCPRGPYARSTGDVL